MDAVCVHRRAHLKCLPCIFFFLFANLNHTDSVVFWGKETNRPFRSRMSQPLLTRDAVTRTVQTLKQSLYNKNWVLAMSYVHEILSWEQRGMGVPAEVVAMARSVQAKITPLLRVPPPRQPVPSGQLSELQRQVAEVMSTTQCLPDGVPVDSATGTCPPGHERIVGADGKPTNCCQKIGREIEFMSREPQRIMREKFGTSPHTAKLRQEFRSRFVPNPEAAAWMRKEFKGGADHLANLTERQKATERQNLNSMPPRQQAASMGISEKLHTYLRAMHRSASDFVDWYLSIDFTRLWIILTLVRGVMWFACAFVTFQGATSWIEMFYKTSGLAGMSSLTALGSMFLPICLAYSAVQGLSYFLLGATPAIFAELLGKPTFSALRAPGSMMSLVFMFSSVTSYYYRLTMLVAKSGVGFLGDMCFLIMEFFQGLGVAKSQLWENGVGITSALKVATLQSCQAPFRSMAVVVGKGLVEFLKAFLSIIYTYVVLPVASFMPDVSYFGDFLSGVFTRLGLDSSPFQYENLSFQGLGTAPTFLPQSNPITDAASDAMAYMRNTTLGKMFL